MDFRTLDQKSLYPAKILLYSPELSLCSAFPCSWAIGFHDDTWMLNNRTFICDINLEEKSKLYKFKLSNLLPNQIVIQCCQLLIFVFFSTIWKKLIFFGYFYYFEIFEVFAFTNFFAEIFFNVFLLLLLQFEILFPLWIFQNLDFLAQPFLLTWTWELM